jgi:hypothetical protein
MIFFIVFSHGCQTSGRPTKSAVCDSDNILWRRIDFKSSPVLLPIKPQSLLRNQLLQADRVFEIEATAAITPPRSLGERSK